MGFLASIILGIMIFLKSITFPYEKGELKEVDDQILFAIIAFGIIIFLVGSLRLVLGLGG